MSVYLQAPHPVIQATVMLPSPTLGDEVAPQSALTIVNAMDGTLYSYVKSNDRLKLTWEFNALTLQKAVELKEFIDTYLEYDWRVIDSGERVYVAKLVNLPVTFSTIGNGEYRTVRLEFEGKQIV
jgi:hypothetical protein